MEFEELRKLQINERKNNELQEVTPDIYTILNSFETYNSEDDIYLYRSKIKCVEEIISFRFNKIVKRAVFNIEANIGCERQLINATPEEKQFYEELLQLLNSFRYGVQHETKQKN